MIADLFQQSVRDKGVRKVLRTIRKHLGMDVAYIAHFRETDRILEHVDADGITPLHAGLTISLDRGYCLRVVTGELPELIHDTATNPAVADLPETRLLSIASHLSVPITLGNGEVYGTLCCFSHTPDLSLGERDLKVMRAFAEVLASHIDEELQTLQERAVKVKTIRSGMTVSCPTIVYQPIYGLKTGLLAGVECLSRFDLDIPLTPSQWFALADEVELRQDLEKTSMRRALATLDSFPSWVYLSINSSPQTVLSGVLAETLTGFDLKHLVVEITEHTMVADYGALRAALQPLRDQGLRLAIDDVGAGYASMRHIINLMPDIIKLDMSLVRSIDHDPIRRALAKALICFARDTESSITAEGIETRAELDMLCQLGVDSGQGYFLKEPVPLDIVCQPALQKYAIFNDQIPLSMPE